MREILFFPGPTTDLAEAFVEPKCATNESGQGRGWLMCDCFQDVNNP
jgi:hypothetical protein